MPLLINHKRVDNDPWLTIDSDQEIPANGQLIVPFTVFIDNKAAFENRKAAIKITADDDFEAVLELAEQFELIVIEIPAFTDGRGFSFARILRRKGFSGQIRAVGDVSRDRLAFLERCGFNAFDIAPERFSDDMLTAFDEMTVTYQAAADEPRPIFRR